MIDRTLNGYTQFIETSQWFIFSHKILNLSAYVLFVWQPRARAFKKMSKNIPKFENNCVEPKLSLKRQITSKCKLHLLPDVYDFDLTGFRGFDKGNMRWSLYFATIYRTVHFCMHVSVYIWIVHLYMLYLYIWTVHFYMQVYVYIHIVNKKNFFPKLIWSPRRKIFLGFFHSPPPRSIYGIFFSPIPWINGNLPSDLFGFP